MRVVIRADASESIGSGHVMRCLTLAEGLKEKGVTVDFVSRQHAGHLCDLIESRGFTAHRLPPPRADLPSDAAPAHAAWLGEDMETDARQTLAAIEAGGAKPSWLIVDHYAIGAGWEQRLRPVVDRIMVIDDLADRAHDADLLLDQNLIDDQEARYRGLVAERCGLMLGPAYALLQPIYGELHERIPPRSGQIRNVLIYFGGANTLGLTSLAVAAWRQLDLDDMSLDVVVGQSSSQVDNIHRLLADRPNARIHAHLRSLAPLMVNADLAVGAAGATSWERLCLGLPSLVVTVADNQRLIADSLHRRGLIRWLGDADQVTLDSLKQALGRLAVQGLAESWSAICRDAVDGQGVRRVVTALTIRADTPLRARPAVLSDEGVLLSWANDPVTRKHAFSPDPIPADTHRKWFRQRLRRLEDCRLYIVETSECIPVGQVRFESQGKAWELHYSLDSPFRGKRLGRRLLETALARLRAELPEIDVVARVKESNPASCAVLQSLGFQRHKDEQAGILMYRQTARLAAVNSRRSSR